MQKTPIPEDDVPVVYSASPILFSGLAVRNLGLELKWQQWKYRTLELRQDASLVVRYTTSNRESKQLIKIKFDLSEVTITNMATHLAADKEQENQEIGILINVKTMEGLETKIRMVMIEEEKEKFYSALRTVCKRHNLDSIKQTSITAHMNQRESEWRTFQVLQPAGTSIMKSAVALAIDSFDNKSRKEHIVAKRGALKWLPVLFSNDLVHGSWWFIIGSIGFVVSSAVVLANSWSEDLGTDDSILSAREYRASWILMTISGFFCTIGSMAFMRAVQDDPPMKPFFKWYHLQSDELLGSWLFLLATVPIIPYSLIYIAASHEELVYLGALAVSIFVVIGVCLFVRSCYPSDKVLSFQSTFFLSLSGSLSLFPL
jgi:hypothetical protein